MGLWTIQPLIGVTPALGEGVSAGLILQSYRIWKPGEALAGHYLVFGAQGGAAVGKAVAFTIGGLPGDLEVPDSVQSAADFEGSVCFQEAAAGAIISFGYSAMYWRSGRAKGAKCAGLGFNLIAGAQITIYNVGELGFVFASMQPVSSVTEVYCPAGATVTPMGHVVYQ